MKRLNLVTLLAALSLTACGVGQVETGAGSLDDGSADLTANAKFETFVGADGQYYFHLLAGNGEKVLASEGYTTRTAAQSGIDSVKANGVDASHYQSRQAADGSPYFVLLAGNGATLGISEMYASTSNANRAISQVVQIVQAVATSATDATSGTRFEIFKGLDNKYYFNLRAANGEIVLQSQSYSSRSAANTGVASVKTNAANAARFQVREAADGDYYFVLKAANGKVIGTSEMYVSEYNANRGVQAVMSAVGGR